MDQFAKYVFVDMTPDQTINMQVSNEIETTKDLFFFLVHLLVKGLMILFGESHSNLKLSMISFEQFEIVKSRMALMGIKCVLDIVQLETPLTTEQVIELLKTLYEMPEDLELEKYKLVMVSKDQLMSLNFELFHRIPPFLNRSCVR
jgi:hypothetical protein